MSPFLRSPRGMSGAGVTGLGPHTLTVYPRAIRYGPDTAGTYLDCQHPIGSELHVGLEYRPIVSAVFRPAPIWASSTALSHLEPD